VKPYWRTIVAGLALLCAPSGVAAQPASTPVADPEAGARLFQARSCVECHATDVARFRRERPTLYTLTAAMWSHVPRMAERIRAGRVRTPYFTSKELLDLAAFLSDGGTALIGEPGDPRRGERLVTDKGCLVCHSTAPASGKRARNLDGLKGLESPPSVLAQMWNHAFLMELESDRWAALDPAEMADLVAFLQQLMRRR